MAMLVTDPADFVLELADRPQVQLPNPDKVICIQTTPPEVQHRMIDRNLLFLTSVSCMT